MGLAECLGSDSEVDGLSNLEPVAELPFGDKAARVLNSGSFCLRSCRVCSLRFTAQGSGLAA